MPGTHASTFGGNPLACACASAVFDVLLDDGVLDHGREMGHLLAQRLELIAEKAGDGVVRETRGLGLLRGVELAPDVNANDVRAACAERGVLVITAGGNTLRIAPPLVITEAELDEGLAVIEDVLTRG